MHLVINWDPEIVKSKTAVRFYLELKERGCLISTKFNCANNNSVSWLKSTFFTEDRMQRNTNSYENIMFTNKVNAALFWVVKEKEVGLSKRVKLS